nr:hypothetical protein CFP56_73885 [Quercus suber]
MDQAYDSIETEPGVESEFEDIDRVEEAQIDRDADEEYVDEYTATEDEDEPWDSITVLTANGPKPIVTRHLRYLPMLPSYPDSDLDGFTYVVDCGEDQDPNYIDGSMLNIPCGVIFTKLVPLDRKTTPFITFTSHGIHTHPPPPPSKSPAAIRSEMQELIGRCDIGTLTFVCVKGASSFVMGSLDLCGERLDHTVDGVAGVGKVLYCNCDPLSVAFRYSLCDNNRPSVGDQPQ